MAVESVYKNVYERKPIITNAAHCARALAFVESGPIYFGLGKSSPWSENENDSDFIPPEPNPNAENLEELIGLKKAERVALVKPDENGEIEYAGMTFKTITKEEAFKEKARWVLLETVIAFDELPPLSYRQIGIFSHVKVKKGVGEKTALLAEDIEDVGILEVLNNRKVVTRQADTKDSYFMIIEC